jgi:hypothetical protein
MPRLVTRREFDEACEAVWTEIKYQNELPRRTEDEARDVPGFLTLLRRYIRKTENAWADNPGVPQSEGLVQVPKALDGLRKVAAVAMRGMIYNGVRNRSSD